MEVEVVLRYGPRFQQPNGRATAGREERLLRLLVGDTSGARSQLSVPYQKRSDPCGHLIVINCEGSLLSFRLLARLQSHPRSQDLQWRLPSTHLPILLQGASV